MTKFKVLLSNGKMGAIVTGKARDGYYGTYFGYGARGVGPVLGEETEDDAYLEIFDKVDEALGVEDVWVEWR